MNYEISDVAEEDKGSLAELRVSAMKDSLESIGRFDPARARSRFLEKFVREDTKKILINNELVGFYVLKKKEDHYFLDHLYFFPDYQGMGLGSRIISAIKNWL